MPKKYDRPFSRKLFETTIGNVVVPFEFRDPLKQGESILRHHYVEHDFSHIFDDNVADHTKRMILYAEHIDIPKHFKDDLLRTIWIHDIPEIMTSTDE